MDRDQIITSEKDLIRWFFMNEKLEEDYRIGTEHEKFIFSMENYKPAPYFGNKGIKQILELLKSDADWSPIIENGNIIGLKSKDRGSISLEPGGQFELSGAPLKNLHETCNETGQHLSELKNTLKILGLGMAGFGFHPSASREDTLWMPKGRYNIMKKYMPKVGEMGLDMMLRTCTIQVNLDFSSEFDMIKKFKTSISLQPIISALFSNSPFIEGKLSGFLSTRGEVWRNTDEDRCGIPKCIFDEDFGYLKWVNYVLDVPMYFINRNEIYHDVSGSSFRDFLNGRLQGFDGERATIKDWEDHLSVIFTDVRLKGYLEMRGADGGPWNRICALPAIWVGLLYDKNALTEAEKLANKFSFNEILSANYSSLKKGLKGNFGKYKIFDLAKELVEISNQGLKNRMRLDSNGNDESSFLLPLIEMLDRRETLSDEMIRKFNSNWCGSVNPSFEDQII